MKKLVVLLLALGACAPAATPRGPIAEHVDPPIVVALKGDWGAGTDAQAQVTSAMCARRASAGFSNVLTTGDNFYDPDGEATERNYFQPEECLLEHEAHQWRATWGNHDRRGDDTRTVLGARRYYRWRLSGVDLFMLDSTRASSSTQRAWLKSALADSDGPVRIAVFHHSPYTTGSAHTDNAAVKRYWVPLFERFGVDIAFSGHSHVYEHHVVRGIDYVVSGGGGRALHRCARERSSMRICRSVYHFLEVSIAGRDVTIRAIKRDGTVFDRFAVRA